MAEKGRNFYYRRLEIGDHDFPADAQFKVPFLASRLIISNDTPAKLSFSLQHPNLDGELFADDDPLVLDGIGVNKVWLKTEATSNVRLWAWRI
jgi:hypothetical protein